MKKKDLLFLFFLMAVLVSGFYFFTKNVSAVSDGAIVTTVKIISTCGNNIKEPAEECDGIDLFGATCISLGYSSGTLACNPNCTYNTSNCITAPPPSGGGGGGSVPLPEAQVVFSGRAYPLSRVVILKDGQITVSTIAGPDSNFQVSLSGLSTGDYIFSVYGEDSKGVTSSLFTFLTYITSGASVKISGIFIAPTISVDKSEVKRGDSIAIFGQSTSGSEVTIAVNSEEEIFLKTHTDKNGVYLYNFDSAMLPMGKHSTRSKSSVEGEISSFSKTVEFLVGFKNVFAEPTTCPIKGDLNGDCRVNLIDFSIAAYWYGKSLSSEFKLKEASFLNGDGKIDLVDFSIMAYYWTG
jgi:hypothetical protein